MPRRAPTRCAEPVCHSLRLAYADNQFCVRDAERPMMFDGGGQHRRPNRPAAWVLRCPDRPVWKIKRGLRCAPPLSRQWPHGLIS
jgi:hypothetical protein